MRTEILKVVLQVPWMVALTAGTSIAKEASDDWNLIPVESDSLSTDIALSRHHLQESPQYLQLQSLS